MQQFTFEPLFSQARPAKTHDVLVRRNRNVRGLLHDAHLDCRFLQTHFMQGQIQSGPLNGALPSLIGQIRHYIYNFTHLTLAR